MRKVIEFSITYILVVFILLKLGMYVALVYAVIWTGWVLKRWR